MSDIHHYIDGKRAEETSGRWGDVYNPATGERRKGEPLLPIGEEFDFKIIKMNEAEKKIGLSVKAVAEDEERTRLEEYQRQAVAATMTIEEVINVRGHSEG